MNWVPFAIAYLWIAGGLGWVHAYGMRKEEPMNWLARTLVVLLFPVLFLASSLEETVEAFRGEHE